MESPRSHLNHRGLIRVNISGNHVHQPSHASLTVKNHRHMPHQLVTPSNKRYCSRFSYRSLPLLVSAQAAVWTPRERTQAAEAAMHTASWWPGLGPLVQPSSFKRDTSLASLLNHNVPPWKACTGVLSCVAFKLPYCRVGLQCCSRNGDYTKLWSLANPLNTD